MTNSEKYLKDERDLQDFIKDLALLIAKGHHDATTKMRVNFAEMVCEWLDKETTPTLTEDERVILRNIAKHSDFEKIGRDKIGGLYVTCRINIPTEEKWTISFYDHLFQFIKERRRISNRGTFERRIKMDHIYPLTIIFDRYGGAYSDGKYTAWNLAHYEIPEDIDEDDVSCAWFWEDNKIPVGKGNTPEEALEDLKGKLKEE